MAKTIDKREINKILGKFFFKISTAYQVPKEENKSKGKRALNVRLEEGVMKVREAGRREMPKIAQTIIRRDLL